MSNPDFYLLEKRRLLEVRCRLLGRISEIDEILQQMENKKVEDRVNELLGVPGDPGNIKNNDSKRVLQHLNKLTEFLENSLFIFPYPLAH